MLENQKDGKGIEMTIELAVYEFKQLSGKINVLCAFHRLLFQSQLGLSKLELVIPVAGGLYGRWFFVEKLRPIIMILKKSLAEIWIFRKICTLSIMYQRSLKEW